MNTEDKASRRKRRILLCREKKKSVNILCVKKAVSLDTKNCLPEAIINESLDKSEIRRLRNRLSADVSRRKRTEEACLLRLKIKELENRNKMLSKRLQYFETLSSTTLPCSQYGIERLLNQTNFFESNLMEPAVFI